MEACIHRSSLLAARGILDLTQQVCERISYRQSRGTKSVHTEGGSSFLHWSSLAFAFRCQAVT